MNVKQFASALFLFIILSVSYADAAKPYYRSDHAIIFETGKFIRTELYFGKNKPKGGTVSESEWQAFVDEIITPRFPDGLTILDALGQWRGKDGTIAREESKVLVLLYPRKDRKTIGVKIEEIRSEYKKRFDQEAVMRIDFSKSVNVSF